LYPAARETPPPTAVDANASASRLTFASVLLTIAFPMMGSVLYLVGGMAMSQVFEFLAGCGLIGAVVTMTVASGRRITVGLVRTILAVGDR
jgi:hypothetical protein